HRRRADRDLHRFVRSRAAAASPHRLRAARAVPRAHQAGQVTTLTLDAVERVRERIARAHALANERFREAFASGMGPLSPNAHMAMQAAALVECASGLRVRGKIRYDVIGDESTPYVDRGKPVYEAFDVDRNAEAIFEYWLVISDIVGATSWR